MNIAFFGTPQLCIPILDTLHNAGMAPIVVITAPDRPVGRKQVLTAPPVKEWALAHNIPVLQPEKLDADFEQQLTSYNLDVSIVVAYGKIIPQSTIDIPSNGTLNIHYSLLPRHRGASPVEAAILAGDTETGVAIQKMVFELDAGPIIATKVIPLTSTDTSVELKDTLTNLGAQLLVKIIPDYLAGDITPVEQTGEITKCFKIKREAGEVNLDELSDEELWRRYRAYHPWPGIYFFKNNKRVKITEASFEGDEFTIEKVIPEGRNEMRYSDFG